MKHIFGLSLLCLLLVACDPMRRIEMKNSSGGPVHITWMIQEGDSLTKHALFMNNSKTVKFSLKPEQPYNRVNMSFGIGSWKPDTLRAITRQLDSLIIRSDAGTVSLAGPDEIHDFLSNRRKGITKRKIVIDVMK
jgi:hypothetical protein